MVSRSAWHRNRGVLICSHRVPAPARGVRLRRPARQAPPTPPRRVALSEPRGPLKATRGSGSDDTTSRNRHTKQQTTNNTGISDPASDSGPSRLKLAVNSLWERLPELERGLELFSEDL